MKYLLYAEQDYAYSILRPLQDAIRERGGEARWFLAGRSIHPEYLKADEARLTTIKDVKKWAPDAVLVPGNSVPQFIPGLKVAVFHGFNVAKAGRSDKRGHFNIRGCFDLYCTQGPNTTLRFKELAKSYGFFRVVETGWAAVDPLFQDTAASGSAAGNKKPTILLCSTFTPRLSCAPHLVDTIKTLRDQGKWHWLVQFHPKMDAATVNQYKAMEGEHLEFFETDAIIPLMKRADVMLSDTSSVMLMFMLQRKPVVTFRNRSRGSRAHLLNVEEPAEIEKTIMHALTKPPELMECIEHFVADYHPYQDGKSSERVLNAVENIARAGLKNRKAKPLNLLRTLKERRKLGYWGL
ncbi:CDP-glycerol glycerophosphotransferase family protein [Thiohalomonas denitrificans]|uniref:CDP-glycerol glycerophosphotransferase, TagB/SpsB family n=1 Tax=Thiohalomonas denitrificans TaxID=415747 RepID=A0A1G5PR93_9GAMM|nr:CDP-glycerol glycerophosphotransferase family protein [Thiohalomonas denitrificans]SCZ51962.1 CDP-glycerol glycerophosphotransferase, TagB/SpsB family [Thiohalomonas denitrificans]